MCRCGVLVSWVACLWMYCCICGYVRCCMCDYVWMYVVCRMCTQERNLRAQYKRSPPIAASLGLQAQARTVTAMNYDPTTVPISKPLLGLGRPCRQERLGFGCEGPPVLHVDLVSARPSVCHHQQWATIPHWTQNKSESHIVRNCAGRAAERCASRAAGSS